VTAKTLLETLLPPLSWFSSARQRAQKKTNPTTKGIPIHFVFFSRISESSLQRSATISLPI
jgi:hypothetical protein